jgi:hypothetical protein
MTVTRALAVIAVCWSAIQLLATMAPDDYSRPVDPAQFNGACGAYAPAVSATAYNSTSGLTLYHVVCTNSGNPLPMETAR